MTDLWIQFSSTAGPDGKQVISVREKSLSGCYRRNSHGAPNKRTGRTEKARIWEVTDRTVRTWIGEAVAAAAADGVTFSVPVTPHTFRHSYAMHMLYAGIPLKVLQSLMGHKSISSTEVYTKVFALDVAARHRVQFSMPESDAVTMLKNRHA
ncbi:tyrosine-type recombinase/integrase [Salmonella enterica]